MHGAPRGVGGQPFSSAESVMPLAAVEEHAAEQRKDGLPRSSAELSGSPSARCLLRCLSRREHIEQRKQTADREDITHLILHAAQEQMCGSLLLPQHQEHPKPLTCHKTDAGKVNDCTVFGDQCRGHRCFDIRSCFRVDQIFEFDDQYVFTRASQYHHACSLPEPEPTGLLSPASWSSVSDNRCSNHAARSARIVTERISLRSSPESVASRAR